MEMDTSDAKFIGSKATQVCKIAEAAEKVQKRWLSFQYPVEVAGKEQIEEKYIGSISALLVEWATLPAQEREGNLTSSSSLDDVHTRQFDANEKACDRLPAIKEGGEEA